ncbi:MAG: hypothetical protein J5501_00185 [Ruminococcus sp.]|nr:hypothetical protein [Ruminococcus sp.]
MKTGELIRYSRSLIKGKRGRLLLICLLPVCGAVTLRTAETAVYCMMLYLGGKPAELFSSETAMLAAAVFAALRCMVCAPLRFAAAQRLWENAEGREQLTPVTEFLTRGSFLRRSAVAAFLVKLTGALALIPAAVSGSTAYLALRDGAGTGELFGALHCTVLTLILFVWWLKVKTGMAAVPFLMAADGGLSPIKLIIRSHRLMRGRRRVFVFLAFRYLLPAVFLFPLPEAGTAAALSISIFLREDEYREERRASMITGYRRTA